MISCSGNDPNDLVDLRSIHVDHSQPVSRRIASFIKECPNPYRFKVGDVTVEVLFDPAGKPFSQAMADALSAI